MKITFWGTRGSVAVSGRKYSKYGGNTTCVEVLLSDGKIVIIDAGTGIRELGNKMIKEKACFPHMFITHSHWDHIQGFPFFKQIYDKKTHIKIYAPHSTNKSLEQAFNVLMQEGYHSVPFSNLSSKIEFLNTGLEPLKIGNAKIETIMTNHPGACYSIKITEKKKTFAFMTDNELFPAHPKTSFKDFVEFASGADLLVHDCMYFHKEMKIKRGWGHSCDTEVARLAIEAGVKSLGLFHHDPERSDSEIDKMVISCKKKVPKSIRVFAVKENLSIKL